jgi:hypothetical protein
MSIRREWDVERICLSALERPAAERAMTRAAVTRSFGAKPNR